MPAASRPHKHKTVAALLAFVLGSVGAHRLYLGSPGWWIYPLFAVTLLPFFAGCIEAIALALTPDEKWDARWNAGSGRRSDNRWGPVLVAIATLMIGTTLLMTALAVLFQAYFESVR
jgi:TM2 domain-containing membrane protein YozV